MHFPRANPSINRLLAAADSFIVSNSRLECGRVLDVAKMLRRIAEKASPKIRRKKKKSPRLCSSESDLEDDTVSDSRSRTLV